MLRYLTSISLFLVLSVPMAWAQVSAGEEEIISIEIIDEGDLKAGTAGGEIDVDNLYVLGISNENGLLSNLVITITGGELATVPEGATMLSRTTFSMPEFVADDYVEVDVLSNDPGSIGVEAKYFKRGVARSISESVKDGGILAFIEGLVQDVFGGADASYFDDFGVYYEDQGVGGGGVVGKVADAISGALSGGGSGGFVPFLLTPQGQSLQQVAPLIQPKPIQQPAQGTLNLFQQPQVSLAGQGGGINLFQTNVSFKSGQFGTGQGLGRSYQGSYAPGASIPGLGTQPLPSGGGLSGFGGRR